MAAANRAGSTRSPTSSWPSPVGQRVVKFRRASEIAHAKTVEPFEWNRPSLPANFHFRFEFLRVHIREYSICAKHIYSCATIRIRTGHAAQFLGSQN